MPEYTWSKDHNAWIKVCSKCSWIYVGDVSEDISIKKFEGYFSVIQDNTTARSRDGFRGVCNSCDSDRRHGRSIINREKLLENQDGKCRLCDKQLKFGVHKEANIDHDHKTGITRGILCSRCNTQMAAVDDELWLAKAIEYRDSFR